MGIYKKLGIRNVAIGTTNMIGWIRIYGFKKGIGIAWALLFTKKGFYKINVTKGNHPILLRNNYSDKGIFYQVFFEKQYEPFQFPFPDADKIIDGGANIGLSAILFSKLFAKAKIIAIEPEENNFLLLKKNTESHYNVTCMQAALWYKNEAISIANPQSLAAGFMVEKSATDGLILNGLTIQSIMKHMDWEKVDIVKLDIEGAEKIIFEQGDNTWLATIKLLIIELHDHYTAGCTKALFTALQPYPYNACFHHENIFITF